MMTQQLFQQYINRKCTAAEKREVERWLHACTSEELDLLLLQVWNDDSNEVMPEKETSELWKRLSAVTIQQESRPKRIRGFIGRKIVVAAAVAALLITTALWVLNKKENSPQVASVTVQQVDISNKNHWSYATNRDSKQKKVMLDDGTEVILFPGSNLQYPAQFEKNRRDIFLEGKAIFSVAKDKQRPFTVYSDHMATTALGTKFLVDESDKKHSTVELYEGKVVVRTNGKSAARWEDKILSPNDVFRYDIEKRTVAVQQSRLANDAGAVLKTPHSAGLNFTNARLADVFEALENKFKNKILYNSTDLTGMYFTGNISQKSSLENVLKIIAQMNGLSISKQNGKYIVQKN